LGGLKLRGEAQEQGFGTEFGAELNADGQAIGTPMQGHRHRGTKGHVGELGEGRTFKVFEGELIHDAGF
jgi:hypothetical protein